MIKLDSFSRYFSDGMGLSAQALANQLNLDLVDKIECIYKVVQNASSSPSDVLLQSSHNILRRSIEQIHLKEEKPFFVNEGQCRGGCEWFIALFLNFKKAHPETSTHKLLQEIAKEFVDGVGIQGACLQKSYQEDKQHQKITHALKFELEEKFEWDLNNKHLSAEIFKKIHELEDGVYLLSFPGYVAEKAEDSVPGHATVVIIESGNYYFFDLNVGLAGTGREIGTENKINDVAFLLAMCQQYSSFDRADSLFKKGLQDLSAIIGTDEVKIIQVEVPDFRGEGRACLGAFGVQGIIDGFKKRNRVFSEKEVEAIFLALCIVPGLMQVKVELSEKLRLKKCVFLDA